MKFEYLNLRVKSLPVDAAISADFLWSFAAARKASWYMGAVKDRSGASSEVAKSRTHLKSSFGAVLNRYSPLHSIMMSVAFKCRP